VAEGCGDTPRLSPHYASRGRLVSHSDGTVISSWSYTYDDVGNVLSQTDKDSNVTRYTYDDVYRLTHVDYPSGSDYGYEYDGVGNRTKMFEYTTSSTITTVYSYDNADELTQYTTSTLTMTFTYASDGCLKTKSDGSDTWQYAWDYERRLKAFKKNGSTLVEYAYNPTGTRRYASDATVGVTNYFHSNGHILGDYNSSWSLMRSYILGANAMVDRTTDPNVTTTSRGIAWVPRESLSAPRRPSRRATATTPGAIRPRRGFLAASAPGIGSRGGRMTPRLASTIIGRGSTMTRSADSSRAIRCMMARGGMLTGMYMWGTTLPRRPTPLGL